MTKLFIWGFGGHAKVVLDIVNAVGKWSDIVFIDDAWTDSTNKFMGHVVVGTSEQLPFLQDGGYKDFVIAIGSNKHRALGYAKAIARGFRAAVAIHPSAIVSDFASIGPGTVIMPRAVINSGAVVGANCIVNTGAIVEHDCVIGDHAHVSPAAVLGGGVTIGAYSHIGLNASILPSVEIGESAVIGAGAVVLRSVPPGQTAIGVPAKAIRNASHVQEPLLVESQKRND